MEEHLCSAILTGGVCHRHREYREFMQTIIDCESSNTRMPKDRRSVLTISSLSDCRLNVFECLTS
jgi:hypothetical protein